jgi:hypothetical protein
MMAEVAIGEAYLAPAVQKSSRFIYFEMLSAACQFIIEHGGPLLKSNQN